MALVEPVKLLKALMKIRSLGRVKMDIPYTGMPLNIVFHGESPTFIIILTIHGDFTSTRRCFI